MKTKDKIIQECYQIFSLYKRPKKLDVCTDCCVSKNEEQLLISISLRDIPFQLLYTYNTAAKSSNPPIEEFKYYLPRFIDLTYNFEFLHHSLELVFSRFDYYDVDEWSNDEKRIIQHFCNHYFLLCMDRYPLPDLESIDSLLIMISKMNVNILDVLGQWESITTETSLFHFADLVSLMMPGNLSIKQNPFADKSSVSQITSWFNNTTMKETFKSKTEELIINGNMTEEEQKKLSFAYDLVHMNYAS